VACLHIRQHTNTTRTLQPPHTRTHTAAQVPNKTQDNELNVAGCKIGPVPVYTKKQSTYSKHSHSEVSSNFRAVATINGCPTRTPTIIQDTALLLSACWARSTACHEDVVTLNWPVFECHLAILPGQTSSTTARNTLHGRVAWCDCGERVRRAWLLGIHMSSSFVHECNDCDAVNRTVWVDGASGLCSDGTCGRCVVHCFTLAMLLMQQALHSKTSILPLANHGLPTTAAWPQSHFHCLQAHVDHCQLVGQLLLARLAKGWSHECRECT
jgi:hypothetical protein